MQEPQGGRRGRVKRLTLPCGGDGLLRGLGLNYVGHSRPHDDDDVLSQWTVDSAKGGVELPSMWGKGRREELRRENGERSGRERAE